MVELTPAMREVFENASRGVVREDAFELCVTVSLDLEQERERVLKAIAQAHIDGKPAPKLGFPSLGVCYEASPFRETREHSPNQMVIVCCGLEAIRLYESPWVTGISLIGKGSNIIEELKQQEEILTRSLQFEISELDQETETGHSWDGTYRHPSQPAFLENLKH